MWRCLSHAFWLSAHGSHLWGLQRAIVQLVTGVEISISFRCVNFSFRGLSSLDVTFRQRQLRLSSKHFIVASFQFAGPFREKHRSPLVGLELGEGEKVSIFIPFQALSSLCARLMGRSPKHR